MSKKTKLLSVSVVLLILGLAIYTLISNKKEAPVQSNESIENITNTEPLGIAELNSIKDVKPCQYEFIVVGEVIITQPLEFDQISGVPCGCESNLTIPFYLHSQKVKVIGHYKDDQDILNAVKPPDGWSIIKWNYSMIWFVSKKYCREEADDISDEPKDSIQ